MNPPSTAGDPQMGRKKPRMCPHCKRHFRRYEHLQRHIRTHTNEKPYVCTCGASFARRDLLKRHQNVAHALLTPETPRSEAQAPVTSIPWSLSGPSDGLVGAVEEQQGQLSEFNATGEASLFNAYDPLPDFESFTHSLGLTLDWGLPSEPGITSLVAREPSFHVIPTPSSTRYTSQEHPDQSLTQLPAERDSVAEFGVLTLPILRITEDHRNRILQALVQFQATVSDTLLPSSNSLTRFVNAFFDGFYPHAPVVHIPTFNVDDCEAEIFLAMAALGAQYRHEHRKGVWLFYAAKSILQEKAREKERKAINENLFLRGGSPRELPYDELMREARCALYLIVFAMWQTEPEIVREAFNLQSFLATCVRESRLEENQESLQTNTRDWHGWVRQESYRRIKLFSFAFLNLLSIEFNLPPVLLSDEVHLRLPSACIEWISPSAERWAAIYNSGHQNQMFFQDALSQLTKSSKESQLSGSQPVPSPLANYILLQALIQRITLVHQAFRSNGGEEHTLLNTQKEDIRNSLRSWTSQWQRAPESSLDPRNPNGPIPFTSTSLLGLAYTRLAFDMGSYRILQCRDPVQIANRLLVLPGLPRGPHLLPAVLHASHALSIPVKLGVEFVARSRAFVWSIEHSLCGLEFAVFLSKWLYCISGTQSKRPLDEHETRLVDWISDIAEEGRTSSDEDICPGPSSPSDCVHLAFVVVKLWAHLIKGNEQWAILGIIGESLDIYADLCREGQLQAPQERNCVDT